MSSGVVTMMHQRSRVDMRLSEGPKGLGLCEVVITRLDASQSPQTLSKPMSEQQPIVVPSRSPSPIPVPAPTIPTLPDYDEDVRPSLLEVVMNLSVIDDAEINRARLGSFVRDSSRILEYVLRADVARLNSMREVSTTTVQGVSPFTDLWPAAHRYGWVVDPYGAVGASP